MCDGPYRSFTKERIKVPFHSIGRLKIGHRLRLIWGWTLDPKDPFSLQTEPSDAQSRLLEPINRAEPVFSEMTTIFCSQFQKNVNPLFNFFITGCLSFQRRVVLLVKWILLWDQINFSFQPSLYETGNQWTLQGYLWKVHSRARVCRDRNPFRSRNLLNCPKTRLKSAIQKTIFHFWSRSVTESTQTEFRDWK